MRTKFSTIILGFFFFTVILITSGLYYDIDRIMIFETFCGSLFYYCKINLLWAYHTGHGLRNANRFSIRGLTITVLILLAICLLPILGLLFISYNPDTNFLPITIKNLRFFSTSITAIFVLSLIMWHLYWYHVTYFYDMYQMVGRK